MDVKYRLEFKKFDNLRFIGHLDLLNVVQRTFKRSKLPIAYSKGFNPHQIMSFALPLSLGMEGKGEVLDFELDIETDENDKIVKEKDIPLEEIKNAINNSAPLGFEVTKVRKVGKEKNSASILEYAEYTVTFPDDSRDLRILTKNFLDKTSVVVEKKGKKTVNMVDIRPNVHSLIADNDSITMIIAQGSKNNLKPELLISAILDVDNSIDFNKIKCCRNKLLKFNESDNAFKSVYYS